MDGRTWALETISAAVRRNYQPAAQPERQRAQGVSLAATDVVDAVSAVGQAVMLLLERVSVLEQRPPSDIWQETLQQVGTP